MRGNTGGTTILGNSENVEPLEGRVHFGANQTLIYDSPDNMSEPDRTMPDSISKEETQDGPNGGARRPDLSDANRWSSLRTALLKALGNPNRGRNG